MTTTQTQIRRDTATNLNAAVPTQGELGYDTTNKRLVVGDGSASGGIKIPSMNDVRLQTFTYSTVGGTANAITLTNSPVVASYASPLRLTFKATGTNSGATTVNVDGIGTKNIYKLSGTSLVALSGNEIVSGAIYDITYDGTQFLLSAGGGSSALTVVSQTFTSSGTYTPTAGMKYCYVEMLGGGGGGGGSTDGTTRNGAGGGAGEYVTAWMSAADIGASKAVTIGAGGAGGTTGTGSTGGTTSLSTLLTAIGGTGGGATPSNNIAGGIGGTGGGGSITATVRCAGQQGGMSYGTTAFATGFPGAGGNSQYGAGGQPPISNGAGNAGTGYGAGGSGNKNQGSTAAGGAGTAGIVIIHEYCS